MAKSGPFFCAGMALRYGERYESQIRLEDEKIFAVYVPLNNYYLINHLDVFSFWLSSWKTSRIPFLPTSLNPASAIFLLFSADIPRNILTLARALRTKTFDLFLHRSASSILIQLTTLIIPTIFRLIGAILCSLKGTNFNLY